MPYDIYGEPLRRGYCEVHPDVPEEYPCSVCMQKHQCESEPSQPEPTVMDYIGFDAEVFEKASVAVVEAAKQNNENEFHAAIERLITVLDTEYVYSILNKLK